MERIVYRKTLDVHKNGVQFLLQGFETADKLSRVIEINLMASGDAIDFPLEKMVAMMYVTTPGATEPSINECTIKDNKVIYDVLPIVKEGITTMQLKLIEARTSGATSVLASPRFEVEVLKSDADDEDAEQTTTFTALEDAVVKAKTVYDERFLRMELDSDCVFKAYYADGTVYENRALRTLFSDSYLLSQSFARGGTGIRAGEDTDNSKYYANVARSEASNARAIMENSEEISEIVKRHGVYTAFSVDFETGHIEYVSPSFKFNINSETGELDAEGQTYTFDDEVGRVITDWLANNGVVIEDLQNISESHTAEIGVINNTVSNHGVSIEELGKRVTPVENGGTGGATIEEAQESLGIPIPHVVWDNEKPSETFPAQEVKLDLSLYNRIHVFFGDPNGSKTYSEMVCTEKNIPYIGGFFGSSMTSNSEVVREFTIRDSGIAFANAKYPSVSTSHNDRVIPYKIKGYKY